MDPELEASTESSTAPVLRRCTMHSDLEEAAETQRRRRGLLDRNVLALAEGADLLYVETVYTVLFTEAANNVSLSQIQAQHQMTNACFNLVNKGAARVPKVFPYNFWNVRGTPGIVFSPLDYTQLNETDHVRRISVPAGTTYSSVDACIEAAGGVVAGKANVLIAPLQGFLGEAILDSNVCCVLWSTVGGELSEAPLAQYGLGITAVHELGHVLGLPHPFGNGCVQVFSDVPPGKDGNYRFQSLQVGDHYEGTLCNRFRDCKVYRDGDTDYANGPGPYSCWNCHTLGSACAQCDNETFEQGCNFMDYADDAHLLMFSQQQSSAMRTYLLSASTQIAVVEGDTSATVPTTDVGLEDSGTPSDAVTDGKASNVSATILGMPVWAFATLMAGVGVLVIVLLVVAIMWSRRVRSSGP
jgi:hypothetical protein